VREAAAGTGPAWLAIESPEEADALIAIARRARLGTADRPPLDVLFRLNPAVAPETAAGLAVGAAGAKFGMTETELTSTVERVAAGADGALVPRGIHLHVGSQLGAVDAWRDAVRRGLALLGLVRGGLDRFDTIDLGGGFPVGPLGQPGPRPERFARELAPLLEAIPANRQPRRLAIEPGRFLAARAGWLVARVLHVRDRPGAEVERQVVLDAGMTELIRPALYGARHEIEALTSFGRPATDGPRGALAPALVEGPICESTDHLGAHDLPPLRRGDLVAFRDAGAYAASLGSTYNGRPRPAQVLLEEDGSLRLARRRGRVADLG
jgi:diaminopimelate decarboxylase